MLYLISTKGGLIVRFTQYNRISLIFTSHPRNHLILRTFSIFYQYDNIVRGPLHGIPILIKDNIATFDKMNNTAGSFALLGAKVPKDSTLAAKLRAAGAIILGN